MKQMFVGAHVRETGPDLGLVKKWDLNSDGLIVGCGLNPKELGKGAEDVKSITNWQGLLDCPDQDLKEEGRGRTLLQRVKDFSGNTRLWFGVYEDAFIQMQSNGYSDGELVDGPNNFWSHTCCFESNVKWKGSGYINVEEGTGEAYNHPSYPIVADPLECQSLCRKDDQCKYFRYNMDWDKEDNLGKCYLYNYEPKGKTLTPVDKLYWRYEPRVISGPKECKEKDADENCGVFKNILSGLDSLNK